MRLSSGLRGALIALIALLAASLASPSRADSGRVYINVVKAGWFIGGSGGNGTLSFHGRRYPLSIGGISAGLVFGASATELIGRVYNIYRPSDITGVYSAVGVGAAVGAGVRVMRLANAKGAVLELRGRQIGLLLDVDLSGMAISIP